MRFITSHKEIFEMFDLNKDGIISFWEIHQVINDHGKPMTEEEVTDLLLDIDSDGKCFNDWSRKIFVLPPPPPHPPQKENRYPKLTTKIESHGTMKDRQLIEIYVEQSADEKDTKARESG